MAVSGIRRKVDDLGRVVIPAGIRRALNIREGDAVEVTVEGERVVIARPNNACVFCSREGEPLHRFRNRLVCADCLGGLGRTDAQVRAVAADGAASGATGVAGVPVPDPLPPSPLPPTPAPEPDPEPPAPDPSPDPLPAPGPFPEPEPLPARAPEPATAAGFAAEFGSGPVDGDAIALASAPTPIRRRPRPGAHADDAGETTDW